MRNMIDEPETKRLLQPENLEPYLKENLPTQSAETALGAYRIRGGHSNETFFIWRGAEHFVLRRPPYGDYLPTAHDVLREFRVLTALSTGGFSVPKPLLLCEDQHIIGAPFYVMEQLNGVIIRGHTPDWVVLPEQRKEIGFAVADMLAALHALDWRAIGLQDFGKPDGYIERQVRRWITQFQGAKTREIADLDYVSGWLAAHIPISPPAAIVHGDYRIDNSPYAG